MNILDVALKLCGPACIIIVLSLFIASFSCLRRFAKSAPLLSGCVFAVLFGAVSIVGTLLKVQNGPVFCSAGDLAPLFAGIVGGPLAGIGAGIIGGIFRYLTTAGISDPSFIASALTTIICGVGAGFVNYFVLKEKKLNPFAGLLVGGLSQVLGSLLVLLLWVKRNTAFPTLGQFGENYAAPMIAIYAIGFAIMIAVYNSMSDVTNDFGQQRAE